MRVRRNKYSAMAGTVALVAAIAVAGVVQPQAALAATTVPGDPLTGSGVVSRSLLTSSDLQSLNAPSAPVDSSGFAVPATAAAPSHQFSGKLTLTSPSTRGSFTELKDTFNYTNNFDSGRKHLPAMSVEFVQNGSHLIPTYQGLFATGNAYWNYIVGPGRIWNETTDGGWSRASVPFALVERNANCTHNGLLTFLFSGSAVSNVRYQITQETCLYFKFNMWGELAATYTSTSPANAETLRNDHAAEVAGHMPIKPIAQLATDFPSSGVNTSVFGSGVTAADMTEYGLIMPDPTNGNVLTNYVSGCTTRFGSYPFCQDMRVPSYSTAKSSFAGAAYMRLVQQNAAAKTATIGGNITEEATYGPAGQQWNSVTFNNAVDMATGHYNSTAYVDDPASDEDSQNETDFLVAESYTNKIKQALDSWPYKVTPGTQMVYHSHDTFLLGRAMQNYAGTDIFTKMVNEVYTPIGTSKGFLTTLRADNTSNNSGSLGQPQASHGLWYNRDDIAKIAKLFNNDNGVIGGSQVLSLAELNAGMQRTSTDRGLDPGGPLLNQKYNNGLWGKLMTQAEFPSAGFACDFWVPRMSGYGGIIVAMMPNGGTYWYFSDNNEFSSYPAIQEAYKLKSDC